MERIIAEVNLKTIKENLYETTKNIPENVKRIAVIKANAYGHGAVEVAKYLRGENASDFFAVATFEEALELRQNGIDCDILVLGYIDPSRSAEAEKLHITLSIGTLDYAERVYSHGSPDAHLQIDTGMSRMGVYCHKKEDISSAVDEIKKIFSKAKGKIKGIYTHFVESDVPTSNVTQTQYESFTSLISALENEGITFSIKHCCNSMGTINFGNFALDAVRIGISLYSPECDVPNLKSAMTFKTKIIKISKGKKGDTVSYCGTHTLERDTLIAVCGAGYADGVSRDLSNKGYYIVNGKKAKILGRVCMDLSMIDVTDIECNVDDEAIIFGQEQPVDKVAELCGTISYELLCNVSKRVPRKYVK